MKELTVEWIHVQDKELVIDEVMDRYGQEILQLAYSYVNSVAIAEDLTQEIFIKCYKNLHSYSGKAKFRTWLWRIAINHCKDFLRSWYNKNMVSTDDYFSSCINEKENTEQAVIQQEEDNELISAVMKLPTKYKEVIYLFYYEELLIKDIALVTKTGTNTVKTRLRRAKALLKEMLEE
ncbi:sigma-70 family RNA polymerase sigma factor [Priestia aryabhattai]|uniref:sigma-70 family RNA polymerase sigma factor n=1 Tax=Priestia aryabhattai TaxID=412384 RepID=UPI000654B533|nr:sigma-70 family RNA polymerase sigma factor [Priestia aryabhattai]KMN92388.1 RNA polymerase factor sigma C [Priestia aryabhattai]